MKFESEILLKYIFCKFVFRAKKNNINIKDSSMSARNMRISAGSCGSYPKGINFYGINFCGTNFCDFWGKLQKIVPQNVSK